MLYLASSSPRRSDILHHFNIPFKQIPNRLDNEVLNPKLSVRAAVRYLALEKARSSADSIDGWVLGVDTIIEFDNDIIGKPKDMDDAKAIVHRLQSNVHRVISAFALINRSLGIAVTRSDTAVVRIRKMNPEDISQYVETMSVFDKAGAYGIQETDSIATLVSGSLYTVMGLPIYKVLAVLKKYDIFDGLQ